MKAWDRLHRTVPGEHLGAPKALEVALVRRERDTTRARKLAGEAVKAIEFKERKPKRLAQTKPNAPLLKRIVRFPKKYEQPMQGKKETTREKLPWELLVRERTVGAFEFYMADRIVIDAQEPIAPLRELRSWARPKLSAADYLDSVGGGR